jgi:hypothetical protein
MLHACFSAGQRRDGVTKMPDLIRITVRPWDGKHQVMRAMQDADPQAPVLLEVETTFGVRGVDAIIAGLSAGGRRWTIESDQGGTLLARMNQVGPEYWRSDSARSPYQGRFLLQPALSPIAEV